MLGVSVRISYCANLVAQVDVLYIQPRLCHRSASITLLSSDWKRAIAFPSSMLDNSLDAHC